jgi:regulator of protease activity HflC (stomatin/prohibitin superfamily)
MKVVMIEERNGTISQIVARFAIDGELPEGDQLRKPDIALLVEVRQAMLDYIKAEKEKVVAALESEEAQHLRDADLVSGVVEVEAKTLAAAEANAAHIAAQAKKAEEAVAEAQSKVKEAKARAVNP